MTRRDFPFLQLTGCKGFSYYYFLNYTTASHFITITKGNKDRGGVNAPSGSKKSYKRRQAGSFQRTSTTFSFTIIMPGRRHFVCLAVLFPLLALMAQAKYDPDADVLVCVKHQNCRNIKCWEPSKLQEIGMYG